MELAIYGVVLNLRTMELAIYGVLNLRTMVLAIYGVVLNLRTIDTSRLSCVPNTSFLCKIANHNTL